MLHVVALLVHIKTESPRFVSEAIHTSSHRVRKPLYRPFTMTNLVSSPSLFPVYDSDILKGFSFITFDYCPDPRSCDIMRYAQQIPPKSKAVGTGHMQVVEETMLLALNQANAGDYEESSGDYEEAEHTWCELLNVLTLRSFFHCQAAKYHLCQVLRKQHRPVAMKDIAWDLQTDLRTRCIESHPLVINSSMLYIYAIAAQGRMCEAIGRFRMNKEGLENIKAGAYANYYGSCQEKMKHLENDIFYRTERMTAIPLFLRFELDNVIAKSWNREKIRTMGTPHQSKEEQETQISHFVEVARKDLYRKCHSGLNPNDPTIFVARQTLGLLLSLAKQHLPAEQHWREMFALQEKTCPGTPQVNISNLSHALNEQDKHAEAEKVALDAISHLEACLSKHSPAVLATWRQVIIARAKQGFKEEAMLLHHLVVIRVENMKYDKWSAFKRDEQVAVSELARKLGFGREKVMMRLELHTQDTRPRALAIAQGSSTDNTALSCTDGARTLLHELEKSFLETVYCD